MPRDSTLGVPPSSAAQRSPGRMLWWLALSAGSGAAVAAFTPSILGSGGGERASACLALGAALVWWAIVLEVMRSDLVHYIIPDEASAAIAALGLVAVAGGPLLSGEGVAAAAAAARSAVETGAGAFAIFWATGAVFRRFGRDALGFGDVKLAGASALWLAPADAAVALELAALGAIAALLLERRRGRRIAEVAVPFGAFLAPSAWIVHLLVPVWRDPWGFGP